MWYVARVNSIYKTERQSLVCDMWCQRDNDKYESLALMRLFVQTGPMLGGLSSIMGGSPNSMGGLSNTMVFSPKTMGGLSSTMGGSPNTMGGLSNSVGGVQY